MMRASVLLRLALPEQLRQPRDVDGNAPRLVFHPDSDRRLPLAKHEMPRSAAHGRPSRLLRSLRTSEVANLGNPK
jgi:hypothetical protein